MEGKHGEEAVVNELDETEVAIGSEFLQGVALLLYLLSDPRASTSSRGQEGSPNAAKICEILCCSDMIERRLEVKAVKK